jgi:nucleoside phosphorylase
VTTGLRVTLGTDYGASATSLPAADFFVITWVDHETGGLAKVLGGGKYTFNSLDGNNFTKLKMNGQAIPEGMDCQGYFMEVKVNGKTVVCFSSNFHPKFNTTEAAQTETFFKAIAKNFGCIITSGTAGGVWSNMDVGDVAVAVKARFGLLVIPDSLKTLPVFTSTVSPVGNSSAPGGLNWFDYANQHYLAQGTCVTSGLHSTGGRKATSKPVIYYQETGTHKLCAITDTEMSNGHSTEGTYLTQYRTMGSSLEENDAFLAQAWSQIGFTNWVSIRNVSDLPNTTNQEQYTQFGYCSSINGAYAIWAFIMGHS